MNQAFIWEFMSTSATSLVDLTTKKAVMPVKTRPRVPSKVSGVNATGKFVAFEQEASRQLQHDQIGCHSLAEKNATRTETSCRYAGLGKDECEVTSCGCRTTP